MTSWVRTTEKCSQSEKMHEGDDDFSTDFPSSLEGLADSLDGARLYHYSPSSCDNNNNIKMRDPLLCLGSVPTIMNSHPVSCVEDHIDKTTIEYHTMVSQSSQSEILSAANPVQNSSVSQTEWSTVMSTLNFGQFYDTQFQYVLNAATTPCSKINDESLTYLNQGQPYELKLKKIGEATYSNDHIMSIVRVIFHERRLQYMEKEQLDAWKNRRPAERILDIDFPLSYGVVDAKVCPEQLSCLHFVWNSQRESSGVYIKVNAISTEFTAKRHGGEKGVPFRIQLESYELPSSYVPPHLSTTGTFSNFSDMPTKLIHCASCQVKVFKPKGADRKYKTDREKIEKKSEAEKEKFQPAFEYTVLSEIPLDQVLSYLEQQNRLNKPAVTSTSVDGNVSSPTPHFQIKQQPNQNQILQQDPFFTQPCNDSNMINATYSLMSPQLPGGGTRTGSLQIEDSVFSDHASVLQSSINDFQRIQQLYPVCSYSEAGTELGYMNISYSDLSRLHKSSPPLRTLSVDRLQEPNECTVSVVSQINNQASPAGSEIKRVIYSPYNSARVQSTPLQTSPLLQRQNSYPHLPSYSMAFDNMTPDMNKAQLQEWLVKHSFTDICERFKDFTGVEMLMLTRKDCVELCGIATGIRLENAIRPKPIIQNLTMYVAAIGKLAERVLGKVIETKELSTVHDQTSTLHQPRRGSMPEISPSVSSKSDLADPPKREKGTKRSRSPDIYCRANRSPSEKSSADDEATSVLVENQNKKYKGDFPLVDEIEVHAIFMEVVSAENLKKELCSKFLLDPTDIKGLYLRKGAGGFNYIVSDWVLQDLFKGKILGVDIRDYDPGNMYLQLISLD